VHYYAGSLTPRAFRESIADSVFSRGPRLVGAGGFQTDDHLRESRLARKADHVAASATGLLGIRLGRWNA
jgi:hypothetical protein